ncbi:hypothetical protein FKG94_14185 [Exilibacterium tricleocarpae]|uniref:Uncharacterized protein n=1 Tax=Exilibacterium tricleocarpae TaxID=2591008 RepID=A0A545TLU2_9GAMM|nr:hypothetical protein [Exilibacterium tricleocarpae]TQV78215.1 hypothetical protein FKG94_14185 [Exilibacterium tricleocarpae]
MTKIAATPLLIVVLSAPLFAFAEAITREQALHLMDNCQAIRPEKIARLKEQEIQRCIENGRAADYCERYYATLGQARNTNGDYSPGLLWDEPVCKKALAAEKYFKANPRKSLYQR